MVTRAEEFTRKAIESSGKRNADSAGNADTSIALESLRCRERQSRLMLQPQRNRAAGQKKCL
jgi:hypothetical protein